MKFTGKYLKALRLIAIGAALLCAAGCVSQSAFAQSSEQSGDRKVKQRVNPAYPELAKQARLSGTVKLEAQIAASGLVKNVKVLGGHPVLAGAAEEALRKWKYEPGSSDSTAAIEFHFNPGM